MGRRDETAMGGAGMRFETTSWTEILHARTMDEGRRHEALSLLLGKYWKPVYCYLRRKGYDNETSKDLVQGFFQEVVLGRELIQKADPSRGKFRTFLLTALDRYATSVHRSETAKKRLPRGGLVHLDDMEEPNLPEPGADVTAADAFHHAWASALLDEVLLTVATGCRQSGQGTHWEVFRARLLRPIMEGTQPPDLTELCTEHGIRDETTASNMITTVKRRFRTVLKRHVRQFVDSDADVDEEIRDLIEILSKS